MLNKIKDVLKKAWAKVKSFFNLVDDENIGTGTILAGGVATLIASVVLAPVIRTVAIYTAVYGGEFALVVLYFATPVLVAYAMQCVFTRIAAYVTR